MITGQFDAPEPARVRRVVAIQLYFLGDTLLATPAIRALKRRFPGAELEVVVKRRCEAVLRNNPHVDRLTPYDPPHVLQRPFHWAALGRRWRSEGVDLAVDLTADGRASRLLEAMRPRQAVGFLRGNLRLRVQAGIPKACGDEHVARHMLRLVSLTGATDEPRLEFRTTLAARAEASAWRGTDSRPLVALHPGCNSVLRRWKLEKFVALVHELERRGVRSWVLGTAAERALGAVLAAAGAEDCTGRLPLEDTAARIEASDLLVANDSGPMHLGAAVGTPTVALFGPSLPQTAAPIGPAHAHFHVRMPCCPCDQRRCVQPKDFCMDRIGVEQVLEAAARLMRARPAGAP